MPVSLQRKLEEFLLSKSSSIASLSECLDKRNIGIGDVWPTYQNNWPTELKPKVEVKPEKKRRTTFFYKPPEESE